MKLYAYNVFKDKVYSKQNKKLLIKEKKEIIKNISEMDDNGKGIMYAIIQVYKQEEGLDKGGMNILNNSSVEIDLDKLPNLLSQILLLFSRTHLTSMKEQINIQ